VTIYEWDEAKNKSNQSKHHFDFETALQVFADPYFVPFVESTKDGEERWHAIGMVQGIAMLVVVHTHRDEGSNEVIRIISCRRASRHERKLYEEAIR